MRDINEIMLLIMTALAFIATLVNIIVGAEYFKGV